MLGDLFLTLWEFTKFWALFLVLFPLMMFLKVVGELVGIGGSILLAPLFILPKWLRMAAALWLVVCLMLWLSPAGWFRILAIWSLVISSVMILITGRYRSVEAGIVEYGCHLFCVYHCYLFATHLADGTAYRMMLTGIFVGGPIYALRSLYRGYVVGDISHQQWRRNAFARKIVFSNGRRTRRFVFTLYLRPFDTTSLFATPLEGILYYITNGGRFTGNKSRGCDFPSELMDDDAENVLATATRPWGRMIALGQTNEAVGAGRAQISEVGWEETAANLMKRAKVIYLLPSITKGTIWELRHILANNYLPKTVFLMPGGMWNDKTWSELVSTIADELTLPEFRFEGAMFMIQEKGQFIAEPLHWDSSGYRGVVKTWRSLRRLHALSRSHSRPGIS